MSSKLTLYLTMTVWGLGMLLPNSVQAATPLTKAVIQSLRNRVRLIPQKQPARPARISDAMRPGDALATARSSLAELRFNDGSLARVGEQAVFRFVPQSRTFRLSDGTLLLLVPPGQGSTRIRTPNAAAGIRGSGIFVRYIPESDTTIVGALTNNPQGPMVVFNQNASQAQNLQAGQLAVIVADRIERLYEFDLKTFYETSDLVKGLNLTQKELTTNPPDAAIALVQAETAEAAQAQPSLTGDRVIENPNFIQPVAQLSDFPRPNPQFERTPDLPALSNRDFELPTQALGLQNNPQMLIRELTLPNRMLEIRRSLEGGEVLANPGTAPGQDGDDNSGENRGRGQGRNRDGLPGLRRGQDRNNPPGRGLGRNRDELPGLGQGLNDARIDAVP